MSNLGWGLEIMLAGMGTVFLMLLVLMVTLMILLRLDKPATEAIESAADDEIPAIASPVAAAAATTTNASTDELVTLAVAIHAALNDKGGAKPSLVANQSGTGLSDSRWVAIGRSMQNQSWQRS